MITIPFTVEALEQVGILAGKYQRYGALIKDVATGRIVGHVQETGLLQDIFRSATTQGFNLVNPLTSVASVGSLFQNELMRRNLVNIENALGSVQIMGMANLAVSAIGVGVSIASTAMVLSKINNLQEIVSEVSSNLKNVEKAVKEHRIKDRLTDVKTDLERLDESSLRLHDANWVFPIEERLHQHFNHFIMCIIEYVKENKIDHEYLTNLLQALNFIASAQIKSLLLIDELKVARARSSSMASKIEDIAWLIPPDVLARKVDCSENELDTANSLIQEMRHSTVSKVSLMSHLLKNGISSKQYLDELSNDQDNVLKLLV